MAFVKVEAQNSIILDTIYANDHKNVALFFTEPIRQGITGSENFVFTYNREKEQYFGLLQAKPGKASNLLVINRNGSIFSYIVKYKEQLSNLNYFIPEAASIGNEKRTIINQKLLEKPNYRFDDGSNYYSRFCSYLITLKQKIRRLKKEYESVSLRIENIVFDKKELYFVIQIENKSTLDYDLNFLNFSVQTRQKGKKKSLQNLYLEPLFMYNMPSKIRENETKKFVFVLSKFSISDNRLVFLELNEKNGERNIKLKVSHTYINNPN